ncbi:hypothetical protein GUJ93_ZPchr0013g37089 [Zizania palustris]|uniref:Uncharacterized protein n=1 Tax=Zizania palustris TaxID=103762 RepID=A0A8J6BVD8_ZIZPA|nr:hypothetical protein GUJ93_ZPchr0013g37089 [Zizania palustris]
MSAAQNSPAECQRGSAEPRRRITRVAPWEVWNCILFPYFIMNKVQEAIMDRAIGIMQGSSKQLLDIYKDKLQSRKTMNVLEVKELRELLEAIVEGLD